MLSTFKWLIVDEDGIITGTDSDDVAEYYEDQCLVIKNINVPEAEEPDEDEDEDEDDESNYPNRTPDDLGTPSAGSR